MIKNLLSSILSGIVISIATITYINASNLIGAFMFTVGLLSIFQFNLKLFTGIISYVNNFKDICNALIILLGNMIGCCMMFLFPSRNAQIIISNKLELNYIDVFITSLLCGILIYIAVEANKRHNILLVIISIMSFITAGFNHSIANICFVISSRIFNLDALFLIIVSIIGNTFGGIFFRKLIEYENSKD